MSTESSTSPAAETSTADDSARSSHGWPRRVLLSLVIVTLLAIPGGWFAYTYFTRTESAPDSGDKLALSIVGGWWNIAGDRHLTLAWEGRRATLLDYAKSDAGVESVGSWRTNKDIVIVHVRGAAGELTQELELVGNDAEMFLAPTPAKQARLIDCWISDHDEDDEDMSLPDSSAHEV